MRARHRTKEHKALQRALCDLRTEKGLSQVQLAGRLGKPQSYVSKYENGERRLDLPELGNICDALGVGLETLVRRYKKGLG